MINFMQDIVPRRVKPGDVFFTRSNGIIGRLIRVFSRTGGESRTKVNHVGVIAEWSTGPIGIEALTKVKRHNLYNEYWNNTTQIAVYRPINLSSEEIKLIVEKAESYVGDSYGYGKIAAHFGDWLLGGRYFFRRFASMDKYPICSWLVAAAYAAANKNFGCEVGQAEPDDIWDFVIANPDKYERMWPL